MWCELVNGKCCRKKCLEKMLCKFIKCSTYKPNMGVFDYM